MQEEFMKYANDKKLLDERIYEKFTEYYIKKLKLEKVVKAIEFETEMVSHYNPYTSSVVLNLEQLYNYAIQRCFGHGGKDQKEIAYFINAELLFYLLHEITHGKQINIIDKREPSNELIINSLAESYDRLQYQKIYNRFHDYYVIEHNANVEGQFLLNDFLLNIKEGYGFDLGPLYYYLTLAYEPCKNFVLSPIEKENMLFYIKLKVEEFIKNEDYRKMSEYDKIRYGFPVKAETFDKINNVAENKVKNYKTYFK